MQSLSHFERLQGWLKGQLRSVERLETDQGSATHLIATAEYELGRLRRELSGLALEPGKGIARLSDIDTLSAIPPNIIEADNHDSESANEFYETASASTEHTTNVDQRHTETLMDRLGHPKSDAA